MFEKSGWAAASSFFLVKLILNKKKKKKQEKETKNSWTQLVPDTYVLF